MRLTAIASTTLVAAGCASNPTADTEPVARACSVSECFSENDVRDFEVVDRDTLIVYVGSQRCAFRVDLRGTFCDLTFAPEIAFRTRNERMLEELGRRANDPFPMSTAERTSIDTRQICANDIDVDVEGDIYRRGSQSLPPEVAGRDDRYSVSGRRSECQIGNIRSLNDDELLEFYVERDIVAPPPPIGPGEIKVEEQAPPVPQTGEATSEPEETAQTDAAPARAASTN